MMKNGVKALSLKRYSEAGMQLRRAKVTIGKVYELTLKNIAYSQQMATPEQIKKDWESIKKQLMPHVSKASVGMGKAARDDLLDGILNKIDKELSGKTHQWYSYVDSPMILS